MKISYAKTCLAVFVAAAFMLAGCGKDEQNTEVAVQQEPTQPIEPANGADIADEDVRMLWAWENAKTSVTKGMTPDEVLAVLGEPSVRDGSDVEMIDGERETLTCWKYDHPENPTEQDRTVQVCFRVDPEAGGELYWVKRIEGGSE